jgi:hypothetical protein
MNAARYTGEWISAAVIDVGRHPMIPACMWRGRAASTRVMATASTLTWLLPSQFTATVICSAGWWWSALVNPGPLGAISRGSDGHGGRPGGS